MTKKPIARTHYDDYEDPGIACPPGETKTQQSAAQECDINYIMKRYEKTGQLPDMIKQDAQWGDFSDVPDYQSALAIVAHAEEQFINLDAHVRRRFNDDPAMFLEFMGDSKNVTEAIRMGLATPAKNADGSAISIPRDSSSDARENTPGQTGGQGLNAGTKAPSGQAGAS